MAKVAMKYAEALFGTSLDANNLDVVYEQFSEVENAVSSEIQVLKELDLDPKKNKEQRVHFAEKVFASANDYLLNMLKVLASNRHLGMVSEVYSSFNHLYNKHNNRDYAVIESVYALSNEELDEIGKKIIQQTKLSKVLLKNEINEQLIGGIRVKVGTKVMDASIQNDLAQLEKNFKKVH
ncbi:F0F1 ATP synthase subunit delta [Staphylococcus durrellii]|uniref:F0F1 ATP synthase subunit delta n=1 Tax=Staphylococcus durrellii TaxID=2781773 RepID=UPI0018A01CDB|nr:F0F1 ATP synthase subunit delta [Staphylococcus durrellii]MBF7016575.1 F0F1 ATP synthase subunit delta [Staphylococcus durrellii]